MYYDLVIIGAGWAGFNAALRAKGLGLKTALIEKNQIGGTCLNQGCIPTKTLIQSAKIFNTAKKASVFGVNTSSPQADFIKIQERKDKIIQQLRSGMQFMLKGIDVINAEANFLSKEEVKAGDKVIKGRFMLVACGSKPMEVGSLKFDGKKVISSNEILNLKEIPGSLLIIGGGVIGCEFASLFSAFGTQVSIVEKMPQLLPGEDKEISKKLETSFKKKGIKVNTDTDASSVDFNNYDLVLLCVGRSPQGQGMGLEKIGVAFERGRIVVDEYLKSNHVPNIYAAGDCAGKIMLAHFAAYQGCLAVENMINLNYPARLKTINIPGCIFTDPEVASVGLNEETAQHMGIEVNVHKFDFMGSGMARILDETEGFIKILSDKQTRQILGASIIGPRATELIGILTLAVQSSLKIYQLKEIIFAHPTLSECISDSLKDYAI